MTAEPTPSPNAARLERTYDASAELITRFELPDFGGRILPRP